MFAYRSRFERDLRFEVLLDPTVPLYASIVGNPAFRAETVVGSEIGYRVLLNQKLYADISAFHNDYDQLAGLGNPTLSARDSPVRRVLVVLPFENSVAATTNGIEITPDWKPLPSWQLKGSYTYVRVSAPNEPGFTNTVFADIYRGLSPRHQVRVQSRMDLPHGLELDQTYRFVDALAAQSVRAYHNLDARIGWNVSERVEVSLVGQNLLRAHHAELAAVPVEIRRSGYIALSVTPFP